MEKIAVVAPMPKASVNTAVRVKPGDLRSWRRAKRRSYNVELIFILLFYSERSACIGWTVDARRAGIKPETKTVNKRKTAAAQ